MDLSHTFSFSAAVDLPDELSDSARFRVWSDLYAQNVRNFEWSRHAEAPFEAVVESRTLSAVTVGRIEGSLASATRGPRQIAADTNERLVLATANSPGAVRIDQHGRQIDNAAGAVFLLSNSEPVGIVTTPVSVSWLNVVLPTEAVLARAPGALDLLARDLPDPSGVLNMLMAYARLVLAHEPFVDPRAVSLAAEHCLDLAVLALGARGHEAEAARLGGLRAVRLHAVLRRISRRFADPALSVETIATHMGVSSRYVHALLHETGQGFTERVLELRLDAALRLLTREQPCRISEAAFAVGFSDLSYFNRCFRRRYGITPSTARGPGPG